jgi:LptD protein
VGKVLNIRIITLTALLTLACFVMPQNLQAQRGSDTTTVAPNDTAPKVNVDSVTVPLSKNAIKDKVEYSAEDSIRFEVGNKMIYLFGKAKVKYLDINLEAEYIEINSENNVVSAWGMKDSLGKAFGRPVFTQKETSFTSDTMRYNFNSKRARISQVITQEGEGFIHGEQVKKDADDNICIRHGEYTTCNLEHPHFSIKAGKLKIIKNDKIVTGPAYLSIEGIPTPLAVPFGFFPNKKGRSSGIVIPTYGYSPAQGYFLRDGGYYFGINDKVDLTLLGDIFSMGSYGVKAISQYANRYKYNGTVDIGYSKNIFGARFLKDIPNSNYSAQSNFFVRWRHTQDTKARPGTSFSANVNAGSANYNSFNSLNTTLILTNTFLSSIAYSVSKSWYNLSLNLGHSQNTNTRDISITLPEGQFNINRFFPFKRKVQVGTKKWYENIGVNSNVNFRNQINTKDSMLLRPSAIRKLQNGVQATVSASTQFKVLKHFTFSPSINYTNRTYFATVEKFYDNATQQLITDTMFFWQNARNIKNRSEFNVQGSLTTRLYTMVEFKRGAVSALRHVLTPQLTMTYRPDFSTQIYGYYGPDGSFAPYSPYEIGVYGQPSIGQQGLVGLNLGNNLEMKVKNKRDTTGTGLKKVIIIEQLNIGASYNVAADSLRLSLITINGRTTLFKNLGVNFNSAFDPYSTVNNIRVNKTEWAENKRLVRLTGANLALNMSLRPKDKSLAKKNLTPDEEEMLKRKKANPDMFIDFNLPYTLNISYNLNYNPAAAGTEFNPKVTQTLNFSGDIRITGKTKMGFTSGYDFINKEIAFTSLDIYRDLHCWELSANWIPFGFRKSYNINVRVKASVLQDLKLTRRRSWQDFQ